MDFRYFKMEWGEAPGQPRGFVDCFFRPGALEVAPGACFDGGRSKVSVTVERSPRSSTGARERLRTNATKLARTAVSAYRRRSQPHTGSCMSCR